MALNLNAKQSLQAEVVDFLCQHLYVGDITNSKKIRIRARINDWRKKGNLRNPIRRKNRLYVDNRDFFGWAYKQKGWEVLNKIHHIHKNATVRISAPPGAVGAVGTVMILTIPKDIEALRAELLACKQALVQSELENQTLRKQLERKTEKTTKASKYGRLGGRPKNS